MREPRYILKLSRVKTGVVLENRSVNQNTILITLGQEDKWHSICSTPIERWS